MRIVFISDTHNRHEKLEVPEGDVLVHSGDLTMDGEFTYVQDFNTWFVDQPHAHKVLIAGNHDFYLERQHELGQLSDYTEIINFPGCHYLLNRGVTIEGVNFYGSPFTPWYGDWAFMYKDSLEASVIWKEIKKGTDVLITHGPPHGILDKTAKGDHAGCEVLRAASQRIKPEVHVFGHIHEGYGGVSIDETTYINACSVNLQYQLVNKPIVYDMGEGVVL